jgi:hypothetical protein
MKKKLTLVLDDAVIDQAKRVARSRGITLSDMVETYLADQSQQEGWVPPAGSILARLTGAVASDPSGETDERRLERALLEKYG